MIVRWRHIAPLAALLLLVASCDGVRSGEPCTGATGLNPDHARLLACTAWLDFVEANTCRVDYVDTIPAEAFNTVIYGRADCEEGRIQAALRRPNIGGRLEAMPFLESLTTLVHEAAHLEDGCRNGEPPALAAERAFLADYERIEDAERAIVEERVRAGNFEFDDLCLFGPGAMPIDSSGSGSRVDDRGSHDP